MLDFSTNIRRYSHTHTLTHSHRDWGVNWRKPSMQAPAIILSIVYPLIRIISLWSVEGLKVSVFSSQVCPLVSLPLQVHGPLRMNPSVGWTIWLLYLENYLLHCCEMWYTCPGCPEGQLLKTLVIPPLFISKPAWRQHIRIVYVSMLIADVSLSAASQDY